MNPTSPSDAVSTRVGDAAQLSAQLRHLLEHAERQEQRLDSLMADAQEQRAQLSALVAGATALRSNSSDARLADLLARIDTSLEQQTELSQQVAKLTRTQFKANTLTETQAERLSQSLVTLQTLLEQRNAAQQARQDEAAAQGGAQQSAARADFAAEFLPAIDGLEAALSSARTLYERLEALPEPPPPPRTLWARLFDRPALPALPAPVASSLDGLRDGLRGWQQGLRLVYERSLKLLEDEGITPLEPLHAPFDPKRHVALEARASLERPGTVLEVLRKGYTQRGRVLRYAEVVVAHPPHDDPP